MAGDSAHPYRCWICLEDESSLEGMISPCACVGTNQWVHQECLKTYCLQHLANHEISVDQGGLRVPCPICKTEYKIVSRAGGQGGRPSSWRELFQWTSTDWQLFLRHARFFVLVAPLICSCALAWGWLAQYWNDLYHNGPGELLTEATS